MITKRFQITLTVLLQMILVFPIGFCNPSNEGLRGYYSVNIIDPSQSPCCNGILEYCKENGYECLDFIQHQTLIHSCRCVPPVEYEMQRYLDSCFRAADEIIATRLEKEMSRMVLRKMPKQTEGENTGYQYPGKSPKSGARQPSLINQYNKLNDISDFQNQDLQGS